MTKTDDTATHVIKRGQLWLEPKSLIAPSGALITVIGIGEQHRRPHQADGIRVIEHSLDSVYAPRTFEIRYEYLLTVCELVCDV